MAIIHAQEIQADTSQTVQEGFKFQQQPGLALAASKIFFSDKRYSISGFGEFNSVPLRKNVANDLGDLELYYSGLYRFATFFGYKITDKLIWNSELQIEYLHLYTEEQTAEFVMEAFLDYSYKDYLKARFGFYPLTIGYINNNDEPVMFYSVNRPEVERLIVPTTWIEFGLMFYGNITKDLSYAFGLSQGLNSKSYLSGTWIRQGREIRFDIPKSISINPQLTYTGVKNFTFSISGYFGPSGQGETVLINQMNEDVNAFISLGTGYIKYEKEGFRVLGVGALGGLSDTDKIAPLTEGGQVLGKNVYAYMFEAGKDILPWFRTSPVKRKRTWLYDNHELSLSLFGRYERLNTHYRMDERLNVFTRVESDLSIYVIGFNFNTRENIVYKLNYQYVFNHYQGDPTPKKYILETGIGFIF
ncbi:MAG TPA: hypothetical protein PKC30_15365 [Saprospiraceae bacterium]|nr:hypothetical protein [Saprospiraceae bacterium]